MGTLYLVATPIGNLEDITLRALRILREAVLIAAEDTRQTQKLLQHFEIHVRTISYHEHNKLSRLDEVLSALSEGDVALVSDAGMPGINDPGYELVQVALQRGYAVSAAPGASAPPTALVLSGLPTDAFLYLGYLPRKTSERRKRLQEVAALPYTLIFLETPHRLNDALEDLSLVFGPERSMAAARELTKLHEEVVRGTIHQVRAHFAEHEPRGEFTLVVGGYVAAPSGPWNEERVLAALQQASESGVGASALAADIAGRSGWSRREVYRLYQTLRQEGEDE